MRRSEHEAREGTGRKRLVGQGYQLEWAEEISQRMVKVERIIDGALLLEVDPEWAGAIKMVLVSKGVRVSELGRSPGYIAAPHSHS